MRTNLPVAPLGNSDSLRVGEWVCAIGNPLAYEHTVTVGVVSYLGRKLFDSSLDNYIQTDAAINFGNSGGPLINGRGEVVGINSAISQRASNIGFAVPINEATRHPPAAQEPTGASSRGFMGVALTDVDPDLRRSLNLGRPAGRARAGRDDRLAGRARRPARLRPDHRPSTASASRTTTRSSAKWRGVGPGTLARLQVMRDGAPADAHRAAGRASEPPGRPTSSRRPAVCASVAHDRGSPLGLGVRDLDRDAADRLRLPDGIERCRGHARRSAQRRLRRRHSARLRRDGNQSPAGRARSMPTTG